MFTKPLPRFVIPKVLASGVTAFYFNVPTLYRRLGCTIPNEPLGADYAIACGDDGNGGRAAALTNGIRSAKAGVSKQDGWFDTAPLIGSSENI
jgi:hypothetical protein